MTEDAPSERSEDLAGSGSAAFERFYDREAARLWSVARALTGSRTDAEDCVQQTFLDLYRTRVSFARARSPRAYALACLRHHAMRLAARRAEASLEDLPREPMALSSPTIDEGPSELARALGRLSLEQREVISLKLDGGLTFAEIGEALSIPANTASSRYRYAMAHLERHLGGER